MTASVARAELEQFKQTVAERLGLALEDNRDKDLSQLLRRRADAQGLALGSYINRLATDKSEMLSVADHLTVGETYFFRNIEQYAALEQVAIAEAMQRRADSRQLSLLSAGCSTGEEPYTLAMLTHTLRRQGWTVDITAMDLNENSVKKARAGRYSHWALREMSPEGRARWFTEVDNDFQIAEELKKAVRIERRNLAEPQPDLLAPMRYDAIFCRNVIMYFTQKTQAAVVARLASALVPGGYLFLGHAETLRGLSGRFDLVQSHGTFYYRRLPEGVAPTVGVWLPSGGSPDPVQVPASGGTWHEQIGRATERIASLLAEPKNVVPAKPEPAKDDAVQGMRDLVKRERFADALDSLSRLPEVPAGRHETGMLRAMLLIESGRLPEAETACTALINDGAPGGGPHYALALCAEGRGESETARTLYGRAIDADPNFAQPRLRRGMLARRAGDTDEARLDLGLARRLMAREDDGLLQLFGGGFTRAALLQLADAEWAAAGGGPAMSETGSSALDLKAAFDRGFADRPLTARERGVELVTVRIGADGHAIALSDLGGLHGRLPVQPVPTPLREFIGLVGIRGAIVPVYDLGLLLGRPAAIDPWLAETRAPRVALAVDMFERQVSVMPEALVRADGSAPFISFYARLAEGAVPVIDIAALLQALEQRAAAAASPGGR